MRKLKKFFAPIFIFALIFPFGAFGQEGRLEASVSAESLGAHATASKAEPADSGQNQSGPLRSKQNPFFNDDFSIAVEADKTEAQDGIDTSGITTESESQAPESGEEESAPMTLTEDPPVYEGEKKLLEEKKPTDPDSSSGSFIFNFPIEVPPGRNGLEPDLKLTYDSGNSDNSGVFGYGWSANIPYIERINREGAESLYSDDYFYSSLDGELKASEGEGEGLLGLGEKETLIEENGEKKVEYAPLSPLDLTAEEWVKHGLAEKKDDGRIMLVTPEEEEGRRTLKSKVYLMGREANGKNIYSTKIYGRDIHFLNNKTGKNEDIVLDLSYGEESWQTEKTPYKLTVSEFIENSIFEFTNKNQKLNFSLADELGNLSKGLKGEKKEKADNSVIFKDILGQGVDISIEPENTGVVKDVIIKDFDALKNFITDEEGNIGFTFKLTSNKKIDIRAGDKHLSQLGKLTSGETVEVIDDEGTASYILAPRAIDSKEGLLNLEIEYELKKDGIYLTKKIPLDWLENANYPVRADTVVSLYGSSGDGWVMNSGTGAGFSNLRDAQTGTASYYTYSTAWVNVQNEVNGYQEIRRGFFSFNTSSLGYAALISSAALVITSVSSSNSLGNYGMTVAAGTQSSTSTLSNGDFGSVGSTALSDSFYEWSVFNLNTDGRNHINPVGWTKFSVRENYYDLLNHNPGAVYGQNVLGYKTSEEAGSDYDPYLYIEYTVNTGPRSPEDLLTEAQTNPTSVSDSEPEFSAIYDDPDLGDYAAYYQIEISTSSVDWSNPVWDSNKTAFATSTPEGSRCNDISYGGTELDLNGTTYYWRIKFWDDEDAEGLWSDGTDYFSMFGSAPNGLRVEGNENPLNIDDDKPEFSAVFNDPDDGDLAVNYQIQVSQMNNNWENPVWDSEKIALASSTPESGRCPDISYGGSSLPMDGSTYYWRIKFWDDSDVASVWSDTNYFITATTTLFGAKIENGNFIKYEKLSGGSWRAYDKKGTSYKFGYESATRQDDPGDNTKVFKWMLEEIRDTNDNYIKYEYYKDNGQIYPSKITYTGHINTDGIFEIEFLREARNDTATSTKTGFAVRTMERINEIRIKVNGTWVKKYQLNYTTGNNGYRSLVNTITEIGQDEQANTITLPVNDFDYQSIRSGWTYDSSYDFIVGYEMPMIIGDFNGDGLSDILNFGGPSTLINDGDGTGWTYDTNYSVPAGVSKYAHAADVNGDGFSDLLQIYNSSESYVKVYINDADGTGWTYNSNYDQSITNPYHPLEFNLLPIGDFNGDGLPDFINCAGSCTAYINDGDGTGWSGDGNYDFPASVSVDSHVVDVNGDGFDDFAEKDDNNLKIYINNGDGTGWTYDSNYDFSASNDNPVPFGDFNGDGLPDLLSGSTGCNAYINKGNGTGWSADATNYTVPNEAGCSASPVDVDGDGLSDLVNKLNETIKVFINNGNKTDLISKVKLSEGAETSVIYKGTPEYIDGSNNLLNPNLPYGFQTVYQLIANDGLGNIATSTYSYIGGDFYYADEYDKRSAGFNRIERTDPLGNITKTYYHQGNATASSTGEYIDHQSKIGKPYRTEIYDGSGNLYSKAINKWENYDLGNERDFVKLTRKTDFSYDGDADHKEKAETYAYNNTYGNLTEKVIWGEVSGADDGSFTDIGTDIASSTIEYIASTTPYIVGLPKIETLANQSGVR
ncbi:MAG: FG-GAP-like repeat-containing protein [Patescibacteria group bacterium]|jgi:hypothetical protein